MSEEHKLYLKENFEYVQQPLKSIRGLVRATFTKTHQQKIDFLRSLICDSEGASILVSGYRGVGKTTLINQTLLEVNPYYQILSGKGNADRERLTLALFDRKLTFLEFMDYVIQLDDKRRPPVSVNRLQRIWRFVSRTGLFSVLINYCTPDSVEAMRGQLQEAMKSYDFPQMVALILRICGNAQTLNKDGLLEAKNESMSVHTADVLSDNINEFCEQIISAMRREPHKRKYAIISISLAQSIDPRIVVFRVIRQLYQDFRHKLWDRLQNQWIMPALFALEVYWFFARDVPFEIERLPRFPGVSFVDVLSVLIFFSLINVLIGFFLALGLRPKRRTWYFLHAVGQPWWWFAGAYLLGLGAFYNFNLAGSEIPYFLALYAAAAIILFLAQNMLMTLGISSWYLLYSANRRTFVESSRQANIGAKQAGLSFGFSRITKQMPYEYDDAEDDLIKIINTLATSRWLHPEKITPVFLFDELDKVSLRVKEARDDRKKSIEHAIGSLKMLFTEQPAYFIFVAGRDATESWMEDQAKGEGLYESIFCQNVYIPSLLTQTGESETHTNRKTRHDQNLLAANIKRLADQIFDTQRIEKDGAARLYEDFYLYLTFKSRGIFRKFFREVHAFIKQDELGRSYVALSPVNVNRVKFYAYIQTIVEEHFETIVSDWDDRARVSIYYLIEHLLKFFQSGFNWSDVGRAPLFAERDEPHPTSHVLSEVLRMLEGRIIERTHGAKRNYKFDPRIKREISAMVNMLDEEQVEFQFIKSDFEKTLEYYEDMDERLSKTQPAERIHTLRIQLTIGSIYNKLKDYGRALEYYGKAIRLGSDEIRRHRESGTKELPTIRSLIFFVACAFEELGYIHEKQRQYEIAALCYSNALLLQIEDGREFPLMPLALDLQRPAPGESGKELNTAGASAENATARDGGVQTESEVATGNELPNATLFELIQSDLLSVFPGAESKKLIADCFNSTHTIETAEELTAINTMADDIVFAIRSTSSQNPEIVHTLNMLAYVLGKAGQKQKSEQLLWVGLVVLKNHADMVGFSAQVKRIGDFYYSLRKFKQAKRMYSYVRGARKQEKITLPIYIRSENYSDLGNLNYAIGSKAELSEDKDFYRSAVDLYLSLNYKSKAARTLYKRSLVRLESAKLYKGAKAEDKRVSSYLAACESLYDALVLCRQWTLSNDTPFYELTEERKYALICLYIGNFCLQMASQGERAFLPDGDPDLEHKIKQFKAEIAECRRIRPLGEESLVAEFFGCEGQCGNKGKHEYKKFAELFELAESCFSVAHDILKDYINIFDKAFLFNREGHLYYKLAIQAPCQPTHQDCNCPTLRAFQKASGLLEEARDIYAIHQHEDPENLWSFADTCVDVGNLHFKMLGFKFAALSTSLVPTAPLLAEKARCANEWLAFETSLADFYHRYRTAYSFERDAPAATVKDVTYDTDKQKMSDKWIVNPASVPSGETRTLGAEAPKLSEALLLGAWPELIGEISAMKEKTAKPLEGVLTQQQRDFYQAQFELLDRVMEHMKDERAKSTKPRFLTAVFDAIEEAIKRLAIDIASETQAFVVQQICAQEEAINKALASYLTSGGAGQASRTEELLKPVWGAEESGVVVEGQDMLELTQRLKVLATHSDVNTTLSSKRDVFGHLNLVTELACHIIQSLHTAHKSYIEALKFYSREYERYQQKYPVPQNLYYFRDDFNDSDEHWKQSVHYKKRRRKPNEVTIPAGIAIGRARKYIYSNKPLLPTRMLAQQCSATASDDRAASGTIYFETFRDD